MNEEYDLIFIFKRMLPLVLLYLQSAVNDASREREGDKRGG